jgi:hypothetical protein
VALYPLTEGEQFVTERQHEGVPQGAVRALPPDDLPQMASDTQAGLAAERPYRSAAV